MNNSTRSHVLVWLTAMMAGMPCMTNGVSHSSWKRPPDMSVPRWEAGSVVFENILYIFGGYKMPTKACKQVDAFDPKDNIWTKLKDLPIAITHMNLVLDGRSVWFTGGFKDGYKGYAISEVWRYDIDKDTYTAGPSVPEPPGNSGLAIVGRKLHYIGGLKKDRDTCSEKLKIQYSRILHRPYEAEVGRPVTRTNKSLNHKVSSLSKWIRNRKRNEKHPSPNRSIELEEPHGT